MYHDDINKRISQRNLTSINMYAKDPDRARKLSFWPKFEHKSTSCANVKTCTDKQATISTIVILTDLCSRVWIEDRMDRGVTRDFYLWRDKLKDLTGTLSNYHHLATTKWSYHQRQTIEKVLTILYYCEEGHLWVDYRCPGWITDVRLCGRRKICSSHWCIRSECTRTEANSGSGEFAIA